MGDARDLGHHITDLHAHLGDHAIWGTNALASSHAIWGTSVWTNTRHLGRQHRRRGPDEHGPERGVTRTQNH